MTAPKHTEGPWHPSPGCVYVRADNGDLGTWNVAEVNQTTAAWEANAYLIAAAPDMHGVLRHIENNAKSSADSSINMDQLKHTLYMIDKLVVAALAKARGEGEESKAN